MTKKIQKKFLYIGIASAVMVTGVLIIINIFLLAPQRRATKVVEESIKDIEQNLICLQTDGNSDIGKLKQQLSMANKTINKYLVSFEEAGDLAVVINKIAKQIGLQELRSTNRMQNSYGTINECQHIREGRIQLNFKSNFNQFAEFINSLERNEPVIFVDYFKINRSGDNGNVQDVEMVLCFFVGHDILKSDRKIENKKNADQALTDKS